MMQGRCVITKKGIQLLQRLEATEEELHAICEELRNEVWVAYGAQSDNTDTKIEGGGD